jgi:hypothetical protein
MGLMVSELTFSHAMIPLRKCAITLLSGHIGIFRRSDNQRTAWFILFQTLWGFLAERTTKRECATKGIYIPFNHALPVDFGVGGSHGNVIIRKAPRRIQGRFVVLAT